jgi:hypothetical protein
MMWKSHDCLRGLLKKYTETFSAKVDTFLANTSDLETQQKLKKHAYFSHPTTTMRILSFGGFDGCTQGGADAAKRLKSTLN